MKFFGILAFTWISAITFILVGIVCLTKQSTKWEEQVIDYTDCLPFLFLTDIPCRKTKRIREFCACSQNVNLSKDLYRNVTVYCQLEFTSSLPANASVDRFKDIPSPSENCNPYTLHESTSNDTCEGVPDNIFNDKFTFVRQLSESSQVNVVEFEKSNRWSSEVTGEKGKKITVLMKNNWFAPDSELLLDSYEVQFKYFYNDERYNVQRKIIITSPHLSSYNGIDVIGIVSLVVGLICLVVSIVLTALWKRILGTETKEGELIIASNELRTNNGQPESLAEEKPLSPSAVET